MSDEKRISAHEMARIQRAAYRRALVEYGVSDDHAGELSRRAYPLPKVERPRKATDAKYKSVEFRVVNGDLQFRWPSQGFVCWDDDVIPRFVESDPALMAARFRLWADLLETPNEYVEDGQ